MGCTLTDQLIGNTFQSLIKTSDNCQLPASGQILMSDGCGSDSSISIGKATQGLLVTGPINGGEITATGQLGGTIVTASDCITTTGDLFAATTASSKVGIGTSTPLEKLTVNGSLSTNGDMHLDVGGIYASNGIGTNGNVLTSTGSKIQWTAGAAGGNFCGNVCTTGASNTICHVSKFTPDGTSIGDSIIQDDGTRIGIGTAPATYKLKVAGTVCSTRFTGPVTGNLCGNIDGCTAVQNNLTVNGTSNLVGDVNIGNIISNTGQATLKDVKINGVLKDVNNSQGVNGYILQSTGTTVQWANLTSLPSAGSAGKLSPGAKIGISGGVIGSATNFTGETDISINATAINGSCINSGTIPDARISSNVKLAAGRSLTTASVQRNRVPQVLSTGITHIGNTINFHDSDGANSALTLTSGATVLGLNGSFQATGDIIAFSASDKRLKENLTCITDSNNIINGLNNYCFDWNDKSEREGPGIGVIAQDVQKVLPNAVCERDNGDLAVDYNQFIPVLLQRVKELSAEVEDLKAKIS